MTFGEKTIIVIFGLLLILVLVGIGFAGKYSHNKSELCRASGGVPIKDRGYYSHCLKPDVFIEIKK